MKIDKFSKIKKRKSRERDRCLPEINPNKIDLSSVTAKIDNKAPRLNPESYLKSRQLLEDTDRLRAIDRENLQLVQRINLIHRLGGKVDCWFTPSDKSYKSKLIEMESDRTMITRENKKLLKSINSSRSSYPTSEYLKDWKRIESNMEHTAKCPLIWKSPNDKNAISGGSTFSKNLSHCYFDIELAESSEKLGRIVFELYLDIAPMTCANFEKLCRGTEGLSYKKTPFHRILPNYWCQGGDVTKFNGAGGKSIYGDKFENENFTLSHIGPGVLSMCCSNRSEDNKCDSKFNITFNSLPTMDGRRVVFGRVIRGLCNLYKIEELGCRSGKPIKKVIISKCGVLLQGTTKKDY
ncbi:peptidyl-prolyl cis-trans isomerase E-like [Athalia rosae]|uniref:peptidyl-prolyl cis-trans isomerase E-like n=1 Tax=Athalia rosae TaxID=37344 RepID=UPI002033DAC9|nr:peptidyl-prolyl cis-trans isomerase E-like [Athalia rosae]